MNRSRTSFEYEDTGRTRRGTWVVSDGKHPVTTVNTEFGTKATQMGAAHPPDFLAKQIATELVANAQIKRRRKLAERGMRRLPVSYCDRGNLIIARPSEIFAVKMTIVSVRRI